MSKLYPDQLLKDTYYKAEDLSGWVQRMWLDFEPSWVVVVLKDRRLVCVAIDDLNDVEE